MSAKFDSPRFQDSTTEPKLTAFSGRDVDSYSVSVAGKEECAKILTELNEEAARYCSLASALGTNVDGDKLRRHLRLSRVRALEKAKDAKNKLLPLLRRKKMRMEDCEDLERMYRVLSACLEYLEQQYYITFLVQGHFSLYHDDQIETMVLIRTGMSESYITKKSVKPTSNECSLVTNLSLRSVGSPDHRNLDREDIKGLEQEMTDLHELVYTMNQSIAIQSWEVDPDLETDKFTVAVGRISPDDYLNNGVDSERNSTENMELGSVDNEHGRLRCVSIIILTIIVVLIGGIVGILMGVLD